MVKQIPDVIYKPQFLKFVELYTKRFKDSNGFGRWLHEYKDMDARGLFKPNVVKALYIKILQGTFNLGFIRKIAIYHIGIYAQDAADAYYKSLEGYLYKIVIITNETAVDEDGDEYTNLEYEEAEQICKALNEEAEEELFFVKRM